MFWHSHKKNSPPAGFLYLLYVISTKLSPSAGLFNRRSMISEMHMHATYPLVTFCFIVLQHFTLKGGYPLAPQNAGEFIFWSKSSLYDQITIFFVENTISGLQKAFPRVAISLIQI